jgi:NADPH-dependent ferric siderophore reductase
MKKQAIVLAVRTWEPGTVLEVDLHLPDYDMSHWDKALHLKCKVGRMTYRDYTPSGWDAETCTCSLLIHAAHDGPGSRWARQLKGGDHIVYRGVRSSHHAPEAGREMVFLGDETAIGHFLALRQLAGKTARITGAIALAEPHHRDEFDRYFPGWEVKPVRKDSAGDYTELGRWVEELRVSDHAGAVFYLAGHHPAVSGLRKLLLLKGYGRQQVRVQGFWG